MLWKDEVVVTRLLLHLTVINKLIDFFAFLARARKFMNIFTVGINGKWLVISRARIKEHNA